MHLAVFSDMSKECLFENVGVTLTPSYHLYLSLRQEPPGDLCEHKKKGIQRGGRCTFRRFRICPRVLCSVMFVLIDVRYLCIVWWRTALGMKTVQRGADALCNVPRLLLRRGMLEYLQTKGSDDGGPQPFWLKRILPIQENLTCSKEAQFLSEVEHGPHRVCRLNLRP